VGQGTEAKIDVRCLGEADKRMMSVDVRCRRKPDSDGVLFDRREVPIKA
jgi:hypothetical protein